MTKVIGFRLTSKFILNYLSPFFIVGKVGLEPTFSINLNYSSPSYQDGLILAVFVELIGIEPTLTWIFSPVLYQLSYSSLFAQVARIELT